MWDEAEDGTPEDYAYQRSLVDELNTRCDKLLNGLTRNVKFKAGPVIIVIDSLGVLTIDAVVLDGRDRAYTGICGKTPLHALPKYIDRFLVSTTVLPTLRAAMLLDDLAEAGAPDATE